MESEFQTIYMFDKGNWLYFDKKKSYVNFTLILRQFHVNIILYWSNLT